MQTEFEKREVAGTNQTQSEGIKDPTSSEVYVRYESARPFILIADDNESFLLFAKKIVEANGYDCITTTSPDITARIAAEKQPALILCDINFGIGKSTAMDVFKNIRMKNNRVPFIIVSALIQQEFKDRAEELGITDYITKPIDAHQLIATIKKHIAV